MQFHFIKCLIQYSPVFSVKFEQHINMMEMRSGFKCYQKGGTAQIHKPMSTKPVAEQLHYAWL